MQVAVYDTSILFASPTLMIAQKLSKRRKSGVPRIVSWYGKSYCDCTKHKPLWGRCIIRIWAKRIFSQWFLNYFGSISIYGSPYEYASTDNQLMSQANAIIGVSTDHLSCRKVKRLANTSIKHASTFMTNSFSLGLGWILGISATVVNKPHPA